MTPHNPSDDELSALIRSVDAPAPNFAPPAVRRRPPVQYAVATIAAAAVAVFALQAGNPPEHAPWEGAGAPAGSGTNSSVGASVGASGSSQGEPPLDAVPGSAVLPEHPATTGSSGQPTTNPPSTPTIAIGSQPPVQAGPGESSTVVSPDPGATPIAIHLPGLPTDPLVTRGTADVDLRITGTGLAPRHFTVTGATANIGLAIAPGAWSVGPLHADRPGDLRDATGHSVVWSPPSPGRYEVDVLVSGASVGHWSVLVAP